MSSADAVPGTSVSGATGPSISVTGSGTVSGRPDRLHLGVEVQVRRPTAPHAYLRAADAVSRVLAALDGPDLPALTRATQQIGLRAETVWGENQEQRISGYIASQTLTISLDDLGGTSAVLDAVVNAGGDDVRIDSLSFGLADPAARARQAQKAAWEDALGKARRWAELAGCTLGAVEELSEGGAAEPHPVARSAMMARELSMPIEPGDVEVISTVTVRWRLNPA